MFKKWRQFRAIHRASVKRNLYRRGYDYAAGVLLRGEMTPEALEAEQARSHRNCFDDGMDMAIHDMWVLKAYLKL